MALLYSSTFLLAMLVSCKKVEKDDWNENDAVSQGKDNGIDRNGQLEF
jgi:hypothetical protein